MIDFKLKYKVWLENSEGKGLLGDGKWELLKLIRDEGSLMAAVDKKGFSYRKTWNKLRETEQNLGFRIIEKSRGGSKGGSTVLTEEGEKLVTAFDHLHSRLDKAAEDAFSEFYRNMK